MPARVFRRFGIASLSTANRGATRDPRADELAALIDEALERHGLFARSGHEHAREQEHVLARPVQVARPALLVKPLVSASFSSASSAARTQRLFSRHLARDAPRAPRGRRASSSGIVAISALRAASRSTRRSLDDTLALSSSASIGIDPRRIERSRPELVRDARLDLPRLDDSVRNDEDAACAADRRCRRLLLANEVREAERARRDRRPRRETEAPRRAPPASRSAPPAGRRRTSR